MMRKKMVAGPTLVLLLLTCLYVHPVRSEACALIVGRDDNVGVVLSQIVAEKTGIPTIETGDTLDNSVKARLQILGVEKVFLLGGPEKIPGKVEEELRNMGLEVERLSGVTPSLTSIVVAKRFWGRATTLVVTDSSDPTYLDQGLRVALRGDNPKPMVLLEGEKLTPDIVTGLQDLGVLEIELVTPYKMVKDELESIGFKVLPIYEDLTRYFGEPTPELLIGPIPVEQPQTLSRESSASQATEESQDPILRRIKALENDETLSPDLREQLRKAKELFQKYLDTSSRGDLEAAKTFLEQCEKLLHHIEKQRTKKFVVIGRQVRNV